MNVKKGHVALFLAATAAYWFTLYAYVPIVGQYATEMKASAVMVGLISGAYGFTQMVARIPLGIISDKVGRRKPFMILGIFFGLFSGIIVTIWQSPTALFLARASAGLGAAAWVPFTVLYASYFKPERAAAAMGTINAVNNGGQLLASLSCGVMASSFGNVAPFTMAIFAGIVAMGLCLFAYEKPGDIKREPLKLRGLLAVAKNKHTLIVGLLGILSQYVAFAGIFGFTPIIAAEMFGATKGELSILTAINTGAAMAGAFLCAGLSKKLKPTRLLMGCYLINMILYCFVPHMPSFWSLCAIQAVIGLLDSCGFTLLLALVLEGVSERYRASAMGFFQAIYAVGMVLGPIITGFIREATGSFTGAYISLGGVLLVAAVITAVSFGKKRAIKASE